MTGPNAAPPNLGVFVKLNDSARNSTLRRSVTMNRLKIEESTFKGRRSRMFGKRVERVRSVNGGCTVNATGS